MSDHLPHPGQSARAEQPARDMLRARARALAAVPDAPIDSASTLDVLEFRLAGERYAFESRLVREVVPLRDLTHLPGLPPFVAGIVNVRGQIVAVIDIKRFFELPDVGLTDLHQVVIIERHGLLFGVLADTTLGVRSLPLAALQAHLPTLTGIRAEYLKGVTADRLVVLDADRLAVDPAIIVEQERSES